MTTAIATEKTTPATTEALPEERFDLYDADWEFYESLLRQVEREGRRVFITYDRGRLEMMSPSYYHDNRGRMIEYLIRILAEELELPYKGAGSTTFKRKDLKRGLEPDDCFYIQNASRIFGKKEIDLKIDPPPDLAVEVEISRRLSERESIYAALGVPELWRYDGLRLRVFQLDKKGKYQLCPRSPTFPTMPLEEIERFLKMSDSMDDMTWSRAFRAWTKENL